MKILTLCSNPFVSLDPITQLLETAGLPKGTQTENKQSFEQWHDQVFEAYEQDFLTLKKQLKPGKIWQEMAGQLILANLSKKQWYWSSSKAGWLLNFWNTIESQQRFVLVYTSPQLGISQSILNNPQRDIDLESAIKGWTNYSLQLLKFYRKHQNKCILVNLQQCLSYPNEFIQTCRQYLTINLETQGSRLEIETTTPYQNIEEELFQQVLKQYPEINTLFKELEASSTPLSKGKKGKGKKDKNKIKVARENKIQTEAWQEYRQLKTQLINDAEIKTNLQQELSTLKQNIKNSDKKEKETKAIQIETNKVKQQLAEQESESELLLLQLHQVQEELEHYFLKHQELEQRTQSNGIIGFITPDKSQPLQAQLIQVTTSSDNLSINLINLQWQQQAWKSYQLQLIKNNTLYEQTISDAAIRLPLQADNLLPLKTWPPQTANKQGAYWLIDTQLLTGEFKHSQLYPEDIAFLHALIHQLPKWLTALSKTLKMTSTPWQEYNPVLEELKPAVDKVFELQK